MFSATQLLVGAAALATVLCAVIALLFRPPVALLDWLSYRLGDALVRVDTKERVLALTFDDAPCPSLTPNILDRLARDGARATFFVIGSYAAKHPALLEQIRAKGHELANHMYTDRKSTSLPNDEFLRELRETDALIFPIRDARSTHRLPGRAGESAPLRKWCRPGHGFLDLRLVRLMRQTGYEPVLASVYPIDLRSPTTLTVTQMKLNLRPGAILVLHDGSPNRHRTLDALDRILPILRSEGYRLVTLSELHALRD